MRGRIHNPVVVVFVLASAALCLNGADAVEEPPRNDTMLRVYLPREVTVEESSLRLGQVGIIRGADELVVRANDIALGRIALPGQKIVIDRPTVLSRLACSGIPASQVTLSGAEQTIVKKESLIVSGRDLLEIALLFLKANKPHESVCQFTPVRIPQDFILPGATSEVKIYPVLTQKKPNMTTIRLMMSEDGKEKLIDEVIFRLKYSCRQVKVVTEIPAGAVITPENVKIEQGFSDTPQPNNWKPPYGLIARRRLLAGFTINENMVGAAKPAIVVKRNQNVLIKVENAGLLITAMGKALQEAHAGQYIKVLNVDSRREIFAKVKEDGTVEPVF